MAISCKDPIATEKFYTKYFGFQRARVAPLGDQQIVFLRLGDMYLELFQANGDSSNLPATNDGPVYPAWRHLGFQVNDVDAKLAEMGKDAQITLGPLNFDNFIPGWRTVWIADPNGNIVEISQGYVDQENPPPLIET
ncbi:VOC family protein [Merismopedia glauca]|uniref:Glyoxalase n=1 Tax=Merismopedia glauca CCAP 1448/3 TaxID=1296344 RepID=A0A2T1C4H0_9CYAN|nr:VOC family protein [Merismopedia glauca]PSB03124.1 glyoxalase [Merismopedia glauca CCAP 1448/3]